MKRPTWIICAVVAITVFTYVLCYRVITHETRQMIAADTGDGIAWLHQEFSLTEKQTHAIAALQQEYEPRCMEMCSRIVAANRVIEKLLQETSTMTPELEAALKEATRVQAECRTSTLRQVLAISAQMPSEQACRYRMMIAERILPGSLRHDTATHR